MPVIQVSSCYFDCCDGEIARLKLMSSKFGAWLDTIVDELSTVGYMVACGWHCHLYWGQPGWDMWTVGIVIGLATYTWSIYCIYFNIIVGVGSANSQDYASKFEIVRPPTSILAEPPVALVDKNVDKKGTREVATGYLEYLYQDEAQALFAKHGYRPTSETARAAASATFPNLELVTIDGAFGGWSKAQKTHFDDGDEFDEIYTPGEKAP